jgi:hypothetical protein
MYDCGNPHCISMSVHMLVCVLMMYILIDCLTVFLYGKKLHCNFVFDCKYYNCTYFS